LIYLFINKRLVFVNFLSY